ncbi:MAG: hypothetical protein LUP91_09890, partial [Methylococcaceae bacterium]|nr:hypothetical protein [Methylococcaceae bacterium]
TNKYMPFSSCILYGFSTGLAFFIAVSDSGMAVSTQVNLNIPPLIPPPMAVCQYILLNFVEQ